MGEAGSHLRTCEVSRAPAPDRHAPDTIPPPEPVSRPRRPSRPVPRPRRPSSRPLSVQACPRGPSGPYHGGHPRGTSLFSLFPVRHHAPNCRRASPHCVSSLARRPPAAGWPLAATALGARPRPQDSNGDWPVLPGELAFHWSSLWAGSGSCSASAGSCALAPPGHRGGRRRARGRDPAGSSVNCGAARGARRSRAGPCRGFAGLADSWKRSSVGSLLLVARAADHVTGSRKAVPLSWWGHFRLQGRD